MGSLRAEEAIADRLNYVVVWYLLFDFDSIYRPPSPALLFKISLDALSTAAPYISFC